jgi:hypothetical protein
VHQNRKHRVPDVIDTIGRRMERLEDTASIAGDAAQSIENQPAAAAPSSVNRARFGAMTARLAQVAAKASADALAQPACAHDPVPMENILRLLSDVRRVADVIADVATGGLPPRERSGR